MLRSIYTPGYLIRKGAKVNTSSLLPTPVPPTLYPAPAAPHLSKEQRHAPYYSTQKTGFILSLSVPYSPHSCQSPSPACFASWTFFTPPRLHLYGGCRNTNGQHLFRRAYVCLCFGFPKSTLHTSHRERHGAAQLKDFMSSLSFRAEAQAQENGVTRRDLSRSISCSLHFVFYFLESSNLGLLMCCYVAFSLCSSCFLLTPDCI